MIDNSRYLTAPVVWIFILTTSQPPDRWVATAPVTRTVMSVAVEPLIPLSVATPVQQNGSISSATYP